MITALTEENPHVNAVRYTHKNRLWTMKHVEYYAEAHAIGFLETGLQAGDVVLSWLPAHFQESMVLQFACSKSGLIMYNLDPALAMDDEKAAEVALREALTLTKANVFISQEAGDDVNYTRIAHRVIPELEVQDMLLGQPFLTPRFPHLRFCIHSGHDNDGLEGWYRIQDFVIPGDEEHDSLQSELDEDGVVITPDTPLMGQLELNAQGIPVGLGKTLTNQQVLDSKVWPTYSKILEKEFHVVEGTGVVF